MKATRTRSPWRLQSRRGSAVVIVLMVLSLISVFSVATAQRLWSLKRDLKLIEQKQLLKFQAQTVVTNPSPRGVSSPIP